MTAFATALATLHADPNMGTAAEFRRPPYIWSSVRVILGQPTDAFGNVVAGSMQADIRAADVTDPPAKGDELRIGAAVYTVEMATRDDLALSWRLTLSEPAEE